LDVSRIDRSEVGFEDGVKRRQIGSKKKRLLGSNTAMLQDSPLMDDAPTFDTTLPAFEEAHHTSKHQKSFQEVPRRVNSSIQEKCLGKASGQDFSNKSGLQEASMPGMQNQDKSLAKQRARKTVKQIQPNMRPSGKAVDAASRKVKDSLPKRKVQTDVGTKRKAAVETVGRRRKAPRHTITPLDFPNYDHLEIIPRKPEDGSHLFQDVSNLNESVKPRQFFKKSPIPDEYKKRCPNKTSRLNLTGSFMKRVGTASKRRSSVEASAIASIILPPQASTRVQVGQQTDNWGCAEDELEGKSTRECPRSKFTGPRMVDASTLTDQGMVTMTVEEFNQVLNLVACGLELASANAQGSSVQEEKTNFLRDLRQRASVV